MKTTVIQDRLPSASDHGILRSLGLTGATPGVVWSEHLLIGVHNEHGEVYRVIGLDQAGELLCLPREFRSLGYEAALAQADEKQQGFDIVVSRPDHPPDEAVPPAGANAGWIAGIGR
jgi:hypothetical protein